MRVFLRLRTQQHTSTNNHSSENSTNCTNHTSLECEQVYEEGLVDDSDLGSDSDDIDLIGAGNTSTNPSTEAATPTSITAEHEVAAAVTATRQPHHIQGKPPKASSAGSSNSNSSGVSAALHSAAAATAAAPPTTVHPRGPFKTTGLSHQYEQSERKRSPTSPRKRPRSIPTLASTSGPSLESTKRPAVELFRKPPAAVTATPKEQPSLVAPASTSLKKMAIGGGKGRRKGGDWLYDSEDDDDDARDPPFASRTLLASTAPASGGTERNHLQPKDDIHDDPAAAPFRRTTRSTILMENDPASARGDIPLRLRTQSTDSIESDSEERNVPMYKSHQRKSNNSIHTTNFALELKKRRGLEIREQDGDGNCLFRAVSLQVYGDPSMHSQIRKQCLDFMERDKEHFSQFVTDESFEEYIRRKRQDGVHGNNPEIQAISELFNRPIEVFSPDTGATPLNIFHAEYKTDDAPIRLSYHDGNHYNAVVDPLVPTAGLGLGLPGLQPGLADKLQMAKAVAASDADADQFELKRALKQSQDDELQRAIKESKLSAEHMYSNEAIALSDMDATYFELEQAALERSLQSYSTFEHGKKQRASTARRQKADRGSPSHEVPSSMATAAVDSPQSAVASLPTTSSNVSHEASLPTASSAAVAPSVASVACATASKDDKPAPILSVDEYPPVVQELAMNGFELAKVVRAVELIGDNFDDLLAFLMANTG